MSDNESDGSEGELLKDWTLVHDIDVYQLQSDESSEGAVTINGSEATASFHCGGVKFPSEIDQENELSDATTVVKNSRYLHVLPLIELNDTSSSSQAELVQTSDVSLDNDEVRLLPVSDLSSNGLDDEEVDMLPVGDLSSDGLDDDAVLPPISDSSSCRLIDDVELNPLSNSLENWLCDVLDQPIAGLEVSRSQLSCSSSGSSISSIEILDHCSCNEASLDASSDGVASDSVECLSPDGFTDDLGQLVMPPSEAVGYGHNEDVSQSLLSSSSGIDASMSSSNTVVSSTEDETSLGQCFIQRSGEHSSDVVVEPSIFQDGVETLFEDSLSSAQSVSGDWKATSDESVEQPDEDKQQGSEGETLLASLGFGIISDEDHQQGSEGEAPLAGLGYGRISDEDKQQGSEGETLLASLGLGRISDEDKHNLGDFGDCLEAKNVIDGIKDNLKEMDHLDEELDSSENFVEQAAISTPPYLDVMQSAPGGVLQEVQVADTNHTYEDSDVDEVIAATEDMANETVDDRCESDISGVAMDDIDFSASSVLDDICLTNENALRTYRHQPNSAFNTTLTCVTLMAAFFALGIGLGHYIGSTRGSSLKQLQLGRLKSMQDEYFVCLNQLTRRSAKQDQNVALIGAICQKRNENSNSERRVFEHQLNNSMSMMHHLGNVIAKEHRRYARAMRVYSKNKKTLNTTRLLSKINARRLLELKTCCHSQLEVTARLEAELAEQQATMADMIASLEELKNTANRLRMENADFRGYIRQLRYAEHLGNTNDSATATVEAGMDALMNVANQLRIENEHLKIYSRRLRYQSFTQELAANVSRENHEDLPPAGEAVVAPTVPASEEPTFDDNKATETKRPTSPSNYSKYQFSVAFLRLQKLVDGIVNEWQAENGTEASNLDPPGRLPVFVTLLKRLVALVGNSTGEDFNVPVYHEEVLQMVDCIEALKNASNGLHMSDVLTSTWDRFGTQLPGLGAQLNVVYEICHRQLNVDRVTEGPRVQAGSSQRVGAMFRGYMNKTFETVAKLNGAIQTTLDRLRAIPSELFVENKSTKKFAGKISGVIAKLESRLRGGWNDVKSAYKKWNGKKHKDPKPTKHAKKKLERGNDRVESGKRNENGKMGTLPIISAPAHDKYHQWFRKNTTPTVASRPVMMSGASLSPDGGRDSSDHKQTRTDRQVKNARQDRQRSGPLRYEEFWEDDSYDPDDYLPDGFFEGNHREWRRQHERRLRTVYGRLQRLNYDIFMSMDDDDIEDLEEMVEDFAEDTEDRNEPVKFRTWISCQVRWWKSRLHRKHRNEDLALVCGRQLMRWQLRVLCEENPPSGDIAVLTKLCKSLDGVVKHKFASPLAELPRHSVNASEVDITKNMGDSGYPSDSYGSPKNEDLTVTLDQDQSSDSLSAGECQQKLKITLEESPFNAEGNDTQLVGGRDKDAEWYFRLVQHREDSQHRANPDWYFALMEDRQFDRTDANWYVRSIRHKTMPRDHVKQLYVADDGAKGGTSN